MRKFPAVLLATIVLAAAGFAAASIASGGRLIDELTGTTDTTATAESTPTTTGTTEGEGHGRKVTICHHTHSQKHPTQTIAVSQNALNAHLRHHDELGACPKIASTAGTHGKGKHDDSGETTTGAVTTTAAPTSGHDSGDHGNGHGSDHGNNGSGHGHH